ncbi:GSCFA domain-containing protein [Agaribacter marinus]|uniref:GSCFA domain-containing protein n=1 Tax=Agaribacter marinus TaxID=1431249 RepID=A0AA37WIE5_9ALTE|nr:GSCFA domain-containing protein [Agaribacter marinus]GLR70862.1 hypothetical protein GCM10007852_17700 [Agaribacter marinus]
MNPYNNQPTRAFWKPAVASRSMYEINDDIWKPKFNIIPSNRVSTYGSCFAQHIGRALKSRGFGWYITEPPPFGLNPKNANAFNYGIFSSRTGNIYTSSLLRQWTEWAFGFKTPPEEVWEKNNRFFDPFRPNIEPEGFESDTELLRSRAHTIQMFKKSVMNSNYFVFTLGLTECWVNEEKTYEYPICPGVAAGDFDEKKHKFKNQQFQSILKNLSEVFNIMRKFNANLKFILTVSPVPLTATYSANHVCVATMESKSILRTVAGQLAANRPYVDYFPSYEMINSPVYKGSFFEPNQRTVSKFGVKYVMDTFFQSISNKFGTHQKNQTNLEDIDDDMICEEQLLEAFGQ